MTGGPRVGPRWWVIDAHHRTVAGPYDDKSDALLPRDNAAAAAYTALERAGAPEPECDAAAVAVEIAYGVRGPDGRLQERPSPADRAWEAHLSEQLDRLSDGWDDRITDDHPQAALLREVATALVEAGFDLHDCASARGGSRALGGVCLTPSSPGGSGHPAGGVIVGWTQHDRMAVDHVRGYPAYQGVQETMNYAVADALTALGFQVEGFGEASAHIVTGIVTGAATATAGTTTGTTTQGDEP
jgi:hypothetical protein